MEFILSEQEREILRHFIDLKIPQTIKNNDYSFKFDLMECYEEMFNNSHSLLDGFKVRENEIHCVFSHEFTSLLETFSGFEDLADFSIISGKVLEIMKKYIFNR